MITPIEAFINRGVLMVGAYLVLEDDAAIGVGALVAFMMLGSRVTQPLVGLARLIEDFTEVRAAVGEVGSVLNNRPEQQSGAGLRPQFEGALSFEDLTFTYPTGKTPALDRVSFSIPAGTMLGVVGRSGSGKSTLTRLLQGVNREYSGFLKIDGAELREINLAHLRRSFGVVLQDNFLFRGSVRDNITAGRAGLTIEDVVRAARLAGAEEFIERLPQGYDTWVEEGSANLSGGQKQRLAIARALITDPRILILDEATSALDPESEALVNANLTRIGRGRTMVIVSHRLASLVECDLILVMDKGQVVDMAPHATLLERCAIYRALWTQQNRHMDPAGARAALLAPVSAQGELRRSGMSLTTTGGPARLTRSQSAQMPALLEFYSPSARADGRASAACGARRDLVGGQPVRRLRGGGGADPDRQGGDGARQGDRHREHDRGAAARDQHRARDRRPGRPGGPQGRPAGPAGPDLHHLGHDLARPCRSPACGPRWSGCGRKRGGTAYQPVGRGCRRAGAARDLRAAQGGAQLPPRELQAEGRRAAGRAGEGGWRHPVLHRADAGGRGGRVQAGGAGTAGHRQPARSCCRRPTSG